MPKIDTLDHGQSQQRDSLTHQAIEDYVKTIYSLALEESPVSTSRIAAARSVKPASATSMIQRLARLKLVNYEKHYGVTLTEAGEKLALEVIRHHRLLELYLMEALGFRWDEVHEQADILEHVISEKMEERIAAMWREILGVEQVGVEQSFFSLGGNSLRAIALITEIQQQLQFELSVRDMFRLQTVRRISDFLQDAQKGSYTPIPTSRKLLL